MRGAIGAGGDELQAAYPPRWIASGASNKPRSMSGTDDEAVPDNSRLYVSNEQAINLLFQ